ncbi:MAG: regulatory subunit-like protein [Myxococcales bacterium]|nr:regulatory subunit-like protein [Myxococcales bacterium]
MVAAELRRLKDKAARAAEKRQYDKAAQLYLSIAEEEAGDPDWRQRAGEAFRRSGDDAQAIEQLTLASTAYARRGFAAKAIAVCKAILQIAPNHRDAHKMVTDLEARRHGHVGRSKKPTVPPPMVRTPAGDHELTAKPYSPDPFNRARASVRRLGAVGEPLIDGRGRAELVRIEDRERGYTPVSLRPDATAEPSPSKPPRPKRTTSSFTIIDRSDSGAYEIKLENDATPERVPTGDESVAAPARKTRPGRKRRTTSR